MDPLDPLGIKDFPAQVEALYQSIDALFANPKALYTQPGWLEYTFANTAGLFQWLAGQFLIVLVLVVICFFAHGAEHLPRAFFGSMAISVVMTLVWNLSSEWGPEMIQNLMTNIQVKNPPTPPTPVTSGQLQILSDYTLPSALGKILSGVINVLPYMAWLSMCAIVAGVGMLALGLFGARWLRISLYAFASSTLSLPLMYGAYNLAKEKGNVNGVPLSGFGMLMIIMACLIPFLMMFAGAVTEVIVKRRSKTDSDVSGDVNADVMNNVDVNLIGDSTDPHTSLDLNRYYEGRSTTPSSTPPQPTSPPQPPEPDKIDKTLTAVAVVGTATGHIEVAAGAETVKQVKGAVTGSGGKS